MSRPNLWAALVNLEDDRLILLNKKGTGVKYWYWIGGILWSLILGLVVLRKKK